MPPKRSGCRPGKKKAWLCFLRISVWGSRCSFTHISNRVVIGLLLCRRLCCAFPRFHSPRRKAVEWRNTKKLSPHALPAFSFISLFLFKQETKFKHGTLRGFPQKCLLQTKCVANAKGSLLSPHFPRRLQIEARCRASSKHGVYEECRCIQAGLGPPPSSSVRPVINFSRPTSCILFFSLPVFGSAFTKPDAVEALERRRGSFTPGVRILRANPCFEPTTGSFRLDAYRKLGFDSSLGPRFGEDKKWVA